MLRANREAVKLVLTVLRDRDLTWDEIIDRLEVSYDLKWRYCDLIPVLDWLCDRGLVESYQVPNGRKYYTRS